MSPYLNPVESVPAGAATCHCCGGVSDFIDDFSRDRIRCELSVLVGHNAIEECTLTDYQLRRHLRELEFADPMPEPPPEFYLWLTNSQVHYPSKRWELCECQRQLQDWSATGVVDLPSIVVDVGCGNGRFLKILEELKRVRAIGLDVNREVVEGCRAQGLGALCGTLALVRQHLPDGVHAVTLWHVVEYVADPVKVLLDAASLLCTQGRIYFSVPPSPLSRETSWPDPLNAPPHHLTRWGIPALHALGAKLEMHISLASPEADPFWSRILRALTLQAVSPVSGLGRSKKFARLLSFLARHPWQLLVETGRQLGQPRISGRVRPDVVMVCPRNS
jgi:SAM-dependent methyltransferase